MLFLWLAVYCVFGQGANLTRTALSTGTDFMIDELERVDEDGASVVRGLWFVLCSVWYQTVWLSLMCYIT
jgi:hypothetical protein